MNIYGLVGRMLICDNGIWRTVRDEGWGVEDAQVVCRQLGYAAQGKSWSGVASDRKCSQQHVCVHS